MDFKGLNLFWLLLDTVVDRRVSFRNIFSAFQIHSMIPLFVKRALPGDFGYKAPVKPNKDRKPFKFSEYLTDLRTYAYSYNLKDQD